MEFFVRIEIRLPPEMEPARKEELVAQELERGHELRAAGVITRMWRIPGRFANVGIWEADDATTLHDHVSSLPLFPWMDVSVTALAQHPLERGQSS